MLGTRKKSHLLILMLQFLEKGGDNYEKWRTVFVSSPTSCTCYDYFGANCYAICGNLV